MTEFSYTVQHLDSGVFITDHVEQMELTEIGTGEVCSAKIRLNNFFGQFVNAPGPVVDQYQRLRVILRDQFYTASPAHEIDRVYDVITQIPIENSSEGDVYELECLSREHHLQKIHFAKQYYFADAFFVVKDIGDSYNVTKGSLNPLLEDHDDTTAGGGGNDLPKFTANIYDFNIAEKYVYDGMKYVVDRLGNSVAGGGANDFFELFFKRGSTNDRIRMLAFSSGSRPGAGNELTISNADVNNEDPTEGGIDAVTGTLLGGWGSENLGSLPPDYSYFAGQLEAFALIPTYISGVAYPAGSRVVVGTAKYQTNFGTALPPPLPPWFQIFARDVIGLSAEYSPWTNNKDSEWINSGSNPDPTVHGLVPPAVGAHPFNLKGMWDANLVVVDRDRFRSWADHKSLNQLFNINYYYGLATSGAYRGQRVLVDGVGTGSFTGFTDALIEYSGSAWVLKKQFVNGEQCAVISLGRVYELIAGVWTDISTAYLSNDCFHIYTSLTNNAGFNSTVKSIGPTTTYGDTSAIDIQWDWTTILGEPLTGLVVGGNTPNYYKAGAWLCLRFPFPHNTLNGVSPLGYLYGNNASLKEPVTVDANNMHLTHSGFRDFNNSEAEDLGPLSSFNFLIKMTWLLGPGGVDGLVGEGNMKMRCAIYDTEDNVMIHDFTIPFNDMWTQVSLPLAGFQIYRARTPLRFINTSQKFVVTALSIENRFTMRNIKQIVIQWQESYDEQGRYDGLRSRANIVNFASGGGRVILQVDGVHFGKPLFTTTAVTQSPVTTRLLEPPFLQLPFISNLIQLRQAVDSQLQIENFRHKQFEIRTDGVIDIDYGDSFFLQKAEMVSDNDPDTFGNPATNNIKLVAKKITYKISKPHQRPGKFERFITGVKRFT